MKFYPDEEENPEIYWWDVMNWIKKKIRIDSVKEYQKLLRNLKNI